MNNIQPIRVAHQKVWYKAIPDTYNEGCWAIEIEIEDQFDSPTPLIVRYPLMIGVTSEELANSICDDLTSIYVDTLNDLYGTKELILCERCHSLFMPTSMTVINGKYYCKDCKDTLLLWGKLARKREKLVIKASELAREGDNDDSHAAKNA